MRERSRSRVLGAMGPLLRPGERVQIAARAAVGKVSVRRQVATAALVSIASGGMMVATVRPKGFFVVLTSQRVLLLEASQGTGRPTGEIALSVPRHEVTVADVSQRMMLKADLVIGEQGLRFAFPYLDRAEGREFVAALADRVTDQSMRAY